MKHWNPDQVDVIVGGVPMSGFSEDGMIELEESEERFIVVKGVDGEITRSKVVARLATLTIKLMNTSRSNDVLSALHTLDLSTSGGAGVVPFGVIDRNGTSLMAAPEGWVNGFPPVKMGKQGEERTWKCTIIDYRMFVGGT